MRHGRWWVAMSLFRFSVFACVSLPTAVASSSSSSALFPGKVYFCFFSGLESSQWLVWHRSWWAKLCWESLPIERRLGWGDGGAPKARLHDWHTHLRVLLGGRQRRQKVRVSKECQANRENHHTTSVPTPSSQNSVHFEADMNVRAGHTLIGFSNACKPPTWRQYWRQKVLTTCRKGHEPIGLFL